MLNSTIKAHKYIDSIDKYRLQIKLQIICHTTAILEILQHCEKVKHDVMSKLKSFVDRKMLSTILLPICNICDLVCCLFFIVYLFV